MTLYPWEESQRALSRRLSHVRYFSRLPKGTTSVDVVGAAIARDLVAAGATPDELERIADACRYESHAIREQSARGDATEKDDR